MRAGLRISGQLIWTATLAVLLAALLWPGPGLAKDRNGSAVALIYHRFGEDGFPSTNIRREQLALQVELLTKGGHRFPRPMALARTLSRGRAPKDRSILVTVDDAYRSALTVAWPVFKSKRIPMVLFVATDPVDARSAGYLNWDEIRALRDDGVVIGHHGASHGHLVEMGLEAALADIERASKRFKAELGKVPKLFAYPYGEYNMALAAALKKEGFTAAFAQYSGAIGANSPAFALPRFPINERYGGADRFRLITGSLALPVSDMIPREILLTPSTNPPAFGFTVGKSISGLQGLACYPSHLDRAASLELLGERRVEVRFDAPFPPGRNRINCTMPGPDGRWYWLGRLFMVPGHDPDDSPTDSGTGQDNQ